MKNNKTIIRTNFLNFQKRQSTNRSMTVGCSSLLMSTKSPKSRWSKQSIGQSITFVQRLIEQLIAFHYFHSMDYFHIPNTPNSKFMQILTFVFLKIHRNSLEIYNFPFSFYFAPLQASHQSQTAPFSAQVQLLLVLFHFVRPSLILGYTPIKASESVERDGKWMDSDQFIFKFELFQSVHSFGLNILGSIILSFNYFKFKSLRV